MIAPGKDEARGFTLIEVLVSLSLFAIISLAVYSAFAGGISAWRKTQEFSSVYQTGRLLLDEMAGELTNTVKFRESEFVGGPKEMSFVTATRLSMMAEHSTERGISKVTYEVGSGRFPATAVLYRRRTSNLKTKGERVAWVDAIETLDFAYTYKDSSGKLTPWSGTWNIKGEIPYGVKISLSIGGARFTKWVVIPDGFQEKTSK